MKLRTNKTICYTDETHWSNSARNKRVDQKLETDGIVAIFNITFRTI